MNGGLVASPSPSSPAIPLRIPTKSCLKRCTASRSSQSQNPSSKQDHSFPLWVLKSANNGAENLSRISLRCNSSSYPGGPSGQGENESKSVLDAFFLGKALAEAINERVESAVGEFLGTIGRLQANQQKQVQDFQEEVLERARRAKERAAREAMEAEGIIPKPSSSENIVAVTNGVAAHSENGAKTAITKPDLTNEDPLLGVSNED